MTDPLATYRGMRDPSRTPEPVPPAGPLPEGNDDTFVIQEHHARSLHWDVRLERDGVLVSWAVPKGLPLDPKTNHLAVHTEDHPIDYGSFEGDIPRGEYGGGKVILWDRGHYELEKWTDREVKVVFHGTRAEGRYVFFRTRGKDWMVHRMDPPPIAGWEPVPVGLRPMTAIRGSLPTGGRQWAYEMAWGGIRLMVSVEGGRTRLTDAGGEDVSAAYPELRALGPALGSRVCLLDGEVVTLGRDGRPSAALLRRRPARSTAPDARSAREVPVTYLVFDLLHLDGVDTTGRRYEERRALLEPLVPPGGRWSVAPALPGPGGDAVAASHGLGLDGIVAKLLTSTYHVGRRSRDWTLVLDRKQAATRRRDAVDAGPSEREVLIGGWVADAAGLPRVLLVGTPNASRVEYVGAVRSGLAADRSELARRLGRLGRKTSPFVFDGDIRAQDPRWVRPSIGARVATTSSGLLSWRGFT